MSSRIKKYKSCRTENYKNHIYDTETGRMLCGSKSKIIQMNKTPMTANQALKCHRGRPKRRVDKLDPYKYTCKRCEKIIAETARGKRYQNKYPYVKSKCKYLNPESRMFQYLTNDPLEMAMNFVNSISVPNT